MSNALTLVTLLLQNATQLQAFGVTLQKAISEGRDVTPEELAAARASLQGHLNELQAVIDAMP
jgi:hypothetical protein